MVYKNTEHVKINKHFHTKHGKNICTQDRAHTDTDRIVYTHIANKEHNYAHAPTYTHMAEKDMGVGLTTSLKARAKKRKREFRICAAEKLLLVKILFEEVSFKASLERREGRAVSESKRKSVPDFDGREAKGTTLMLFSFKEGDAKEEHRDLEGM